MNALLVVWEHTLCVISLISGLMIIQHSVCNLSRWTYSIRSVALWWNALLLGGGVYIVGAYSGGSAKPIFGEVLVYLGVALQGVHGMRRIYREYADDPKGLWMHLKTEILRISMIVRAFFK